MKPRSPWSPRIWAAGLRTFPPSPPVAHDCGAAVIEDAAQGLGAFFGGRSVGLSGDIGFFSLAVGKGLTTYEGGVLFSRDPDLHAELQGTASRVLRPGLL